MAKRFATKNGVNTNVLNSYDWYGRTAKCRNRDMVFNKEFRSNLTERDKNLMRGYAQAVVDRQNAFRYHNPDYVRKTK